MNATHIEVTPGVGYTLRVRRGSSPLRVQSYTAAGKKAEVFLIEAEESAYIANAYTLLSLYSAEECAWMLTPLHQTGEGTAGSGEVGVEGALAAHVADAQLHVTEAERTAWNAKAAGTDLVAHREDAQLHVTEAERVAWNAKTTVEVDEVPTAGSARAVASGGVYEALWHGGSGANSVAVGEGADASGLRSTAVGYIVRAEREGSTAVGYYSEAAGEGSTAVGSSTHASGDFSTAVGNSTSAEGRFSTAVGYGSEAEELHGTGLGYMARSYGEGSTAVGSLAEAQEKGLALGCGAASPPRGFSMGYYAYNRENGTGMLRVNTETLSTHVYVIAAGSRVSVAKLGGKAGLGYLVYDAQNNTVEEGCVAFESIRTGESMGLEFAPYDPF